jgi:hypothetical protein
LQTAVQVMDHHGDTVMATEPENTNSSTTSDRKKKHNALREIRQIL